ncbi:MAG: DUF4157 domain-containing protein [Lachnospiraceae bacterium]|nr:DUF4157 domain-containing protein [Lachnospiraceae bacterium]
MGKKLLENAAAEHEANEVGFRYMNSSDVLGDMRRDYGSALDGVKVHDDADADAKVRAVGRDGLASGKDVYMREGSLSEGAPEVNGLLAHELTHVMQQDGGMQESVDYGEAQGGLIDWFKSKFKKKDKRQEAFAAAMPSLGEDDKFDAGAMSQDIESFKPEMQGKITEASQNISSTDGNRFFFMREGKKGDGTGRFNYFRHLKAAGRKVNIATMKDLAKGAEALPSTEEFGTSYKSVRGWAKGTQTKDDTMSDEVYAATQQKAKPVFEAYQDRGVEMTRAYLDHLAGDEESMEALRQSSAMYSQLGTYSEQNKKGLLGGQLEADHRAMNDMILRSFGVDAAMAANGAKTEGTGMSKADQKKIAVSVQAMGAMQPAVLAHIMDPNQELTPQEAQIAQMYSAFFAQLHGNGAGAAAPQAAPAPAQEQTPFVPGKGPKETMSYRSDEIGALAADPHFDIDPTSSDPKMMAVIARRQYDKLKALQKSGADPEEIRRAVLSFKEARDRMSWQ